MAWIESHQALQRHRKTIRAANLLKITRPLLIGHLHCLWWWALDNADSDGRLGQVSAAEIAEAAEWSTRQADRFLDALVDAGFLEVGDDGALRLHDWYDYAGKLCDRRTANAERMRAARSGRVSLKEVARDPARVEHVQRTFDARAQTRAHTCGATQPDPTGPNRTGPDNPPLVPPEQVDDAQDLAAGAATTAAKAAPVPLVKLSEEARAVLEFWRQAHGKRTPPRLNPTQAATLEDALLDLGFTRLTEAVTYMAARGVPELSKAINAARTKRQREEQGDYAAASPGTNGTGPKPRGSSRAKHH